MDITHSYEGLGDAYRKARKGSPAFAAFMVQNSDLSGESDRPYTLVELGIGSGQQTEFVEAELRDRNISEYNILAFDKSFRANPGEAPGQLDILAHRIQNGELSDRITPLRIDFDGAPLPLESESADLVYMAHVIHHLTHKEQVIAEVARVLRKGSSLFILGVTLEDMRNHPLDGFFPTKYDYETGRYPEEDELKHMFLSAGLTFEPTFKVGSHNVRPIDRDFLASVADTTIDSALMLMREKDPAAFREGVQRVEAEVEKAEKSGDYHTYRSADRLRIFWGRKN